MSNLQSALVKTIATTIGNLEKIRDSQKNPSNHLIQQLDNLYELQLNLISITIPESTKEYKKAVTSMSEAAKKTEVAINDLTKLEKAIQKVAQAISMATTLVPARGMLKRQSKSMPSLFAKNNAEKPEKTHQEKMAKMEQDLDVLKKTKALHEQQLALKEAENKNLLSDLTQLKKSMSSLKLPEGKKGEITITTKEDNTALLRSKRPLLEILDAIAHELTQKICPKGTVLVTENQLKNVAASKLKSNLIDGYIHYLITTLDAIQNKKMATERVMSTTGIAMGAELVGASLDVVKQISELFRVDREIEVFENNNESIKLLQYLFESQNNDKSIVTNLEENGNKTVEEADKFWKKLTQLTHLLDTLKNSFDQNNNVSHVDKDTVDTRITEIESLLEELDPVKHSDAFWKQVKGEMISSAIFEKPQLLMEVETQILQVNESRWFSGKRIFAIAEVQVLYRLLNKDGTLNTSGVILKASKPENMYLDKLKPLHWMRP